MLDYAYFDNGEAYYGQTVFIVYAVPQSFKVHHKIQN